MANQRRQYRSFKDARDFARKLKLQCGTEWFDFTKSGKLPGDIPTNVPSAYRDTGWSGWERAASPIRIANTARSRQPEYLHAL